MSVLQGQERSITTKVCPTCGCSLVRLGIDENRAPIYSFEGKAYYFCCEGCVDLFTEHPARFIKEIENIVVCPVCLAEKPIELSIKINYQGNEFFFCRCTHCREEFLKNPTYYLDRLAGRIDHQGLFGNSCCQS